MSEKLKKALRIAVNVGCGFEGDAEDAAELLTLITDLEARIAELEAERRWIPVSERLPEFGPSILFYDSILERTNKGTCTALNRDKTNLQWLTDDGIYYHGNRCEYITHWKEEPARPEAESERFTVHSEIKRQDNKSPNDTQTQTFVYGKESEE